MVDVVKQPFDVKLQNPVIPPASLARDSYRIQRRFSGSVAVGVRQKARLYHRLNDLFDHHLGHAVGHRWNTQNALPATLLRNGDRFDRWGKVAARGHSIPDLVEIALQVRLEILDRLLIHPGRSRIGFDRFVGLLHQPLVDDKWFCCTHPFPPVSS